MTAISMVDPTSPATGTILIFDNDTFSRSKLYPPGVSASSLSFTWDVAVEKRRILRHNGPDGTIAGEITFYGTSKKGFGTVKRGAEETPIEQWGAASKECIAVEIQGQRYICLRGSKKSQIKSSSGRSTRCELLLSLRPSRGTHN
jgi:hypothetical protein